jgi:hypothetical protein
MRIHLRGDIDETFFARNSFPASVNHRGASKVVAAMLRVVRIDMRAARRSRFSEAGSSTGSDLERKIGVRSRRPKSEPRLFALDSRGAARPTASPGPPHTASAPLRLTCVQTDIIKEGGLSTYQKRSGARYQSDCTRDAQTSSLSDRAEFMQQARS